MASATGARPIAMGYDPVSNNERPESFTPRLSDCTVKLEGGGNDLDHLVMTWHIRFDKMRDGTKADKRLRIRPLLDMERYSALDPIVNLLAMLCVRR